MTQIQNYPKPSKGYSKKVLDQMRTVNPGKIFMVTTNLNGQ
jgi:hypothetical protein